MSSRRWQNIAKFFFDISKLIIASAVVSQFVIKSEVHWKTIAYGSVASIFFLMTAFVIDKKGDEKNE